MNDIEAKATSTLPREIADEVHALERCMQSQRALEREIDQSNPGDPYASLMVSDDIELLERLKSRIIANVSRAQSASEVTDSMVQRFLSWRLPKPWHPDNGISYQRPNYAHAPAEHDWPTGTNLFDANQARAMLEHVLAAAPRTQATA